MEKDSNAPVERPQRVERREVIDDPNLLALIVLLMVLGMQWFSNYCTC